MSLLRRNALPGGVLRMMGKEQALELKQPTVEEKVRGKFVHAEMRDGSVCVWHSKEMCDAGRRPGLILHPRQWEEMTGRNRSELECK